MNNNKSSIKKMIHNYRSITNQPFWLENVSYQMPEFLKSNLIDDSRVIRLLPQNYDSYLCIFMYQLLKHCFEETESEQNHSYLNNFMDLFEQNYQSINLPEQCIDRGIDHQTIKKLIEQFLQMMSQSQKNTEQQIAQYPIIVHILLNLFQILLSKQKMQFSSSQPKQGQNIKKLRKLCEIFGIDYALYEECFQFTITEHYLYFVNTQFLFLIYIDIQRVSENMVSSEWSEGNQQNYCINQFPQTMQKRSKQTISFQKIDILFDKTNQNKQSIAYDINTADTDFKKNQILQSVIQQQQSEKQNSFSQHKIKQKYMNAKKNCYDNNFVITEFQISKQFTDSKIIRILKQPYQTRIRQIKNKARAQRQKSRNKNKNVEPRRRQNIRHFI